MCKLKDKRTTVSTGLHMDGKDVQKTQGGERYRWQNGGHLGPGKRLNLGGRLSGCSPQTDS